MQEKKEKTLKFFLQSAPILAHISQVSLLWAWQLLGAGLTLITVKYRVCKVGLSLWIQYNQTFAGYAPCDFEVCE